MSRFLLPLLLLGPVSLATQAEPPLTLDPGMYADALRTVQEHKQKENILPPSAHNRNAVPATMESEAAEWCLAMQQAGTPQCEVRLILLLQRLNPGAGVDALAGALRLHQLVLAGNAPACGEIAEALRNGRLPGGLAFIRCEALARALDERQARFQLCPARPTGQPEQSEAQPPSDAKASGASS